MVIIKEVRRGSPADRAGIKPGDRLLSLDGHDIRDVIDFEFYITEPRVTALVERDGQALSRVIKNPLITDAGLVFDGYLMDKKRSCANNCIFCFIDQNPKGMRETIYFKDDDERLSFLQGSYITLTNLTDRDIARIKTMHISPINVSVHTMNPELRIKMLRNRRAGDVLRYIDELGEAGIMLNIQIVLCRGINDGAELEFSLSSLCGKNGVESIAVVPCGLTRHREGLAALEPFTAEESASVIDTVERFAKDNLAKCGERICFCSDEFYLAAHRVLPSDDYYDGYPQLDNGVGGLRNHREEFVSALAIAEDCVYNRSVAIITGKAAEEHIRSLVAEAKKKFPLLNIRVFAIRNDFYGETVTVSGLVTGNDIISQMSGVSADLFLIPRNMLRAEGDLFLDGVSLTQLEAALKGPVETVSADGSDLCDKILGREE